MPSRHRIRKKWAPEDVAGTLTVALPEAGELPDWEAAFGRKAPLHVEIGFGKGDFLKALAILVPGGNVVGIEIKWHLVHWVESKLLRAEVANVRLTCANARWQLGRLFAQSGVDAFYVNFPDPWPKARHAKRRLLHPELATSLERFLKPGGTVTVLTDVADYAAVAIASFEAHPAFEKALGTGAWTERLEGYPETIHERKFRAAGRTIHYVRFQKIEGSVYSP